MVWFSNVQTLATIFTLVTSSFATLPSIPENQIIWSVSTLNFSAGWDTNNPTSLPSQQHHLELSIELPAEIPKHTRAQENGTAYCNLAWKGNTIATTWHICSTVTPCDLNCFPGLDIADPVYLAPLWFRVVSLDGSKSAAIEVMNMERLEDITLVPGSDEWRAGSRYIRRRNTTIYFDSSKRAPFYNLSVTPDETIRKEMGLVIPNMSITIPSPRTNQNCTLEFDIKDQEVSFWDPAYPSYNTTEKRFADQTHCTATWNCTDAKQRFPMTMSDLATRANEMQFPVIPICDSTSQEWSFDLFHGGGLVFYRNGKFSSVVLTDIYHHFRTSLGSPHEPDLGALVTAFANQGGVAGIEGSGALGQALLQQQSWVQGITRDGFVANVTGLRSNGPNGEYTYFLRDLKRTSFAYNIYNAKESGDNGVPRYQPLVSFMDTPVSN